MKKKIYFISGGIIIFLIGVMIGKYYFSKTEIKIKEIEVTKTEWKYKYLDNPDFTKENFNMLLGCYNSSLDFTNVTKDNEISVTAFDACKNATVKYRIKARDLRHHIIQTGAIYQYKLGLSYEASYLYDFDLFAFGCGIIISKNNFGAKLVIQKSF